MHEGEQPLTGGNATPGGAVRHGDTVRKPWLASTDLVRGYMSELADRAVPVPRHFGCDDRGRQVIEFIPGTLAHDHGPLNDDQLIAVGQLIRRIHDASESVPVVGGEWVLIPSPKPPNLLCHNDLAPWNLVLNGDSMTFIDWDGAGPSTREWDLAYAAQSFAGIDPSAPPEIAGRRLRCVLDGYAPSDQLRQALSDAIVQRTKAMHDLLRMSAKTGRQPWCAMFASGHGAYWSAAADYAAKYISEWRRASRIE
ncbi:MAG TPA: phosphotransferase [Flexivirga sp.]|uniref:phosphotransferase n=1 Tax=Flexivirga sp. TaxID=1962927 RepID=UPI002B95D436|nr:phosphotransferase [Flexivirga sp.]HWC20691.1 phosphotransferase [Flexivirga sp.]